jgi:1,4-alpha-glucan branching enzyme
MVDLRRKHSWHLDAQSAAALAQGVHSNRFSVLRPHDTQEGRVIRSFLPGAMKVEVLRRSDSFVLSKLEPTSEPGLFENLIPEPVPYRLRIHWPDAVQETEGPYSFGLLLGDIDLHSLNEGRHLELAHSLGAQIVTIDGVAGVRFAVWAPNATRVAVVGDFNLWDRRRHPMRVRYGSGVWELFVPRVAPGSHYQYDILGLGSSTQCTREKSTLSPFRSQRTWFHRHASTRLTRWAPRTFS